VEQSVETVGLGRGQMNVDHGGILQRETELQLEDATPPAGSCIRHREAVAEWFDGREKTLRELADRKGLAAVAADRQAFSAAGTLPKDAPVGLRVQPTNARTALEKAYKAAADDYVRAKKDAAAEAVDRELVALGKSPTAQSQDLFQPCSVWKGFAASRTPVAQMHAAELIVTERNGAAYKAKFIVGKTTRDVEGTVLNGTIRWAGAPGSPNPGHTHGGSIAGKKISVRYGGTNPAGVAGDGTVQLDYIRQDKK